MISDNFYPEAYSLNGGEISLTADVLTLSDSIADNMLPYYIGYVSYENMPSHWKFNTAEIVNDNTVSVDAITQNYGWGFLYHWNDIDGSNIAMMRPCLIADVSGTKTDLSGAGYSHHFVNHGIIASANFANRFRLFFSYIAMPTSWLTEDDSCIYSKWAGHYCEALTRDVYLSYEQIIDFLDNEGTITLTGLSYNTTSNSITFKASDFGAETHTAKLVSTESPGYTVFVQLTNVFAMGQQAYVQSNNTKTNSRFTPFFAMNIKGNGTTIADQKALVCPNDLAYTGGHYLNITFDGTASDQQKMTAIGYSSSDHSVAGSSYMGNLKLLDGLTQQDFRQRGYGERTYYWYADGGIIRGRYIVSGSNTLTCGVAVPMELEDMRRIACFLMNKIETNVTGAAAVSDFTDASRGYTTDFSTALFDKTTSDPLNGGTRVYQNFVDIADKLCLWQYPYTDLSVDRFTEDLIPEYVPPGPEPSGDEFGDMYGNCGPNSGSSGYVSNFVTPWVLTSSQLSEFGLHLWKDLLDFDAQGQPIAGGIWQNAKIAVDTYFATGSFDPASVMDFILSVRYFPIDFQKAEYATQFSVPAVYFGTGRVGVDVTTQPWIADSLGIYIDGGDFNLAEWGHKYNDWRDVGNASAEIFIPFCGTYPLPWSEVKDKTLELSYHVDIISGAMTVYVEATNGTDRDLVAVGSGLVGFEIPVTATSANRLNAAILSDLGGMSGTIADTNQVAAALTGANASALAESKMIGPGPHAMGDVDDGVSIDTGSFGGIKPTLTNALGPTTNPLWGLQMAKAAAPTVLGISQRPGISPTIMPGGRGWGALCGKRIPFIKVHKGRYPEDTKYAHTLGYPVFQSKVISSCNGYTQCMNVDTSGIPCTSEERAMIKALLEGGFYA